MARTIFRATQGGMHVLLRPDMWRKEPLSLTHWCTRGYSWRTSASRFLVAGAVLYQLVFDGLAPSMKIMAFFDKILVRQIKYFPGAGAEMGKNRSGRGSIMMTLTI